MPTQKKHTEKPILLWKSMQAGMKSSKGNIKWEVGKWEKCESVSMCNSGFHASERMIDAMKYINCEVLAQVEVRGKSEIGSDKQV